RERRSALLTAISGLREDDRLIIGYRYFLELDEAETGEALGIARGTVKSRLSRALRRLRSEIRPDSPIAPSAWPGGDPALQGDVDDRPSDHAGTPS
ncbi:MAG: hypothetical protein M3R05_07565, partial [Chloroflexota bacterium]|nr:hypothetical protein [Chloroflexota bacterium]